MYLKLGKDTCHGLCSHNKILNTGHVNSVCWLCKIKFSWAWLAHDIGNHITHYYEPIQINSKKMHD